MNDDVKLCIVRYLSLPDALMMPGFENSILLKYRSIWFQHTKTRYFGTTVSAFLQGEFLFGTCIQSSACPNEFIESIVFSIGMFMDNDTKIESTLLLYMAILECPEAYGEFLLTSLQCIFPLSIYKVLLEVCHGMGDYYAKVLDLRRKQLDLEVCMMLNRDQIDGIYFIAMESIRLRKMVQLYQQHTNKSDAI